MPNLLTIRNITLELGTESSGATWTYSPLCAGIDNLAEALNETVQQYFFLCQGGFATNHVTGMAPALTITGRRIVGDAAQDYIFSKKYSLDTDRESSLKLSWQDGAGATQNITVPVVLCNIQEWSGATNDDSAISVELRFNGAPTLGTAS